MERIHLLKSNGIVKLSFSFSFAIRFAFTSLFSLRAKNWSSPKIIILSVCILTILNKVPVGNEASGRHILSRVAAALAWRGALSSSPFLILINQSNKLYQPFPSLYLLE